MARENDYFIYLRILSEGSDLKTLSLKRLNHVLPQKKMVLGSPHFVQEKIIMRGLKFHILLSNLCFPKVGSQ